MHLTNYSINKKNPEFVRCDDAEQEDFGNKWTLGALLRYLRDDGVDTAALMSRIEQVVIKTIISVEGQIAAACKTFVPYRGNCAELYGFDVLIDDTLKPWILEVNLSPSLATDAPLDLKLKSNVIADFLNLMGVESVDPLSRRSKDARLTHAYNLGRSGKNSTAASPSQGQYDTSSLSPDDAKLLRWVQDQHERRGGFLRIFPRADTWANYGALLEYKTHTNELLASRLFKETYRPYSSVVRNKFNERTESSRFNRYEERLEPLDKKKKKKRRKKKSKTKKSSAAENLIENDDYEDEGDYAAPIETISSSSQQSIPIVSSGTSTRRPVPLPKSENEQKPVPKPMKKSVENSDIYRSIKEAQKKKTGVSKSPEKVEEIKVTCSVLKDFSYVF